MKSLKNAALAFAFVLGAGFLAGQPARAGHCSLAKAAGDYGFTITGTVIIPGVGPAPIAAIGRAKVLANGDVSGTEARNVGGQYADETLNGTYTVNADCTGALTISFFEAGQLVRVSVLTTVQDDDNTEIRMVQKSLTLPDGSTWGVIATVEARKIERDQEN
jgi:hypothetical protein